MSTKKQAPVKQETTKVKCPEKEFDEILAAYVQTAEVLKKRVEGKRVEKAAKEMTCRHIHEMGRMIWLLNNGECPGQIECPGTGECVPDLSYC